MLKRSIATISFLAFVFTATGCATHQAGGSAKCVKLKREMVHHMSAHEPKAQHMAKTKQSEHLKQQLAEANCN